MPPKPATAASTREEITTVAAESTLRATTASVFYLGVVFCLLFTAFNLASSYQTSIYPDDGALSLAVLYGAYGVGSAVASTVEPVTGVRLALWASSAFYGLWMLPIGDRIFRIVTSGLLGLASSVLWVHQAVWLARMAERVPEQAGFLNGVFILLLNGSLILGNVLALVVDKAGGSIRMLLWVLVGVAYTATGLMSFIAPVREQRPEERLSFSAQMSQMGRVSVRPTMLLLIPVMTFHGFARSFTYGWLGKESGVEWIPIVFLAYGITSAVAGPAFGRIFDRVGWKPLVACHLIFSVGHYGSFAAAINSQGSRVTYLLVSSGGFYGIADAALLTLITMIILQHFPEQETSPGFAIYNLVYCVGTSVGFAISTVSPTSPYLQFFITVGFCALAIACCATLNVLCQAPLSAMTTKKTTKAIKHSSVMTKEGEEGVAVGAVEVEVEVEGGIEMKKHEPNAVVMVTSE